MYKVVDLFCGCGGLSEGFKLSGYQIVGGVDFNQPAIDTFNLNFKGATGYCGDLSEMDKEKITEVFGDITDIDIIIGGPPCQGFSSANRWQNEQDDPRNRLFFEFVKFVDMANPKAIVIENVQGIITRNNGYAKKRIYEIFESRGYSVNHCILNAADYGVPQYRKRNFFVILKGSRKFDFNKLKKVDKPVTVEEAIGELYNFESHNSNAPLFLDNAPLTPYQKYLRNKNDTILNHEVKYPAEKVQERISHVPQGGNWRDVPAELWPSNRQNRHSSAYKRLDPSDRSCTIDTGNAHSNYFHPLYNRIPTPREAARLQSFPDDFVFNSNRGNNYRQIGNAVPPLLAKAIADALKPEIKKIEEDINE
ncbi:DNA (cytosine-5)-methyltransferase 1 [Selenomonas ruminantium]|uniref:Cytosine-specific methyltransferase n=1 Tax=Selenomonas ruminantium TaxID=971 RepID=A0A1I3ER41_SELRU|nr:DNA cytosine methyltransferase [Selenomonas ruminantium]SFI01445.1 DNA (cytosine-5)-methyltransferase 1 [Selenomonas ruminantium]